MNCFSSISKYIFLHHYQIEVPCQKILPGIKKVYCEDIYSHQVHDQSPTIVSGYFFLT
jgi:hypothetical protein